ELAWRMKRLAPGMEGLTWKIIFGGVQGGLALGSGGSSMLLGESIGLGLTAYKSLQETAQEEAGGAILTTNANQAEKLINSGANEVTVESWADADTIRRNLIEGQGYRNSTGYTGRQVRNNPDTFPEGKARTFHWDYADTQHGGRPHLQIHTPEGRVIRIFFEKGAGIPIRTPTGKR